MNKGKRGLKKLAVLLTAFMLASETACDLSGMGSTGGTLNGGTNNEVTQKDPYEEYYKFILNEDGQSYSVGFWESEEEIQEVMDKVGYDKTMEESIKGMYELVPQMKLTQELVIQSEYNGLPVTSVIDYGFAFYNFTKVVIPSTITEIGEGAFQFCFNLMSLKIDSSVFSIGERAFFGCYRIYEVWDKSCVVDDWYSYVGSTITGKDILRDENYTSKITTDENGFVLYEDGDSIIVLNYLGNETNVIIPQGVTEINDAAFLMKDIERAIIPDSVRKIGGFSFTFCNGLTSVVIENTEGWYMNDETGDSSEKAVSSEDISNAKKMAEALRDEVYCKWYRK